MSNVALNPDQSNTKQGGITAVLADDVASTFRSHLVLMSDNSGVAEVELPSNNHDVCLYLLDETGSAGDVVNVTPLEPGKQIRIRAEGAIDAGEVVALADATTPADAGMVRALPAAADDYFSPGIAEGAAADGQLVLVRYFPRVITVTE